MTNITFAYKIHALKRIKMSKKILFCLFFLLSIFSSHAAPPIATVSDESIIGVNCSSNNTMCLDSLSIQTMTFFGSTYKCIYDTSGNCVNTATDKLVLSKNKYAAADAMGNSLMTLSRQTNPNNYMSGYSCSPLSDGLTCSTTYTKITTTNGVTTTTTSPGGGFSIGVFKYPQSCNTGGLYLPGLGCTTNSTTVTVNGVSTVISTNRTVPAISSSCQPCSNNPNLAQLDIKPVTGNPINLMNGSKIEQKTDLSFPFEFSRNYSSKRTELGLLGYNWKSNFDKKLEIFNGNNQDGTSFIGTVIVTEDNDEFVIFTRNSGNAAFKPASKTKKTFL